MGFENDEMNFGFWVGNMPDSIAPENFRYLLAALWNKRTSRLEISFLFIRIDIF